MKIRDRFRGFLPVVVDVETGGFNSEKDALLELAAVLVNYDLNGRLVQGHTLHYHIKPFPGANLDPESLRITGIDPFHPLRPAYGEKECAERFFGEINRLLRDTDCNKAILVGHNASFDLAFIRAWAARTGFQRIPFHSFSTLDTVSLGALVYGQTVLSKIAQSAGFDYDGSRAHGAKYDAELTAAIFCQIVNIWGKNIGTM